MQQKLNKSDESHEMGKQNELKKKLITNNATAMEIVKEKYVSVEIEKVKMK